MPIETNVDDLSYRDVVGYIGDLLPSCVPHPYPREMLRELVGALDRASPDWPHTVLGLPLVEVRA